MWKNLPCSVWESLGNLTLFLPVAADSAIYFVIVFFFLFFFLDVLNVCRLFLKICEAQKMSEY